MHPPRKAAVLPTVLATVKWLVLAMLARSAGCAWLRSRRVKNAAHLTAAALRGVRKLSGRRASRRLIRPLASGAGRTKGMDLASARPQPEP